MFALPPRFPYPPAPVGSRLTTSLRNETEASLNPVSAADIRGFMFTVALAKTGSRIDIDSAWISWQNITLGKHNIIFAKLQLVEKNESTPTYLQHRVDK